MKEEMQSIKNSEEFWKEDMRKNPHRYVQPWEKKDSFGRWYMNPDFVKLYGNFKNKRNKRDIYLEENPEELAQAKEDWNISRSFDEWEEIMRGIFKQKHTMKPVFRDPDKWDKQCSVCNQWSKEECVHCWYCGMLLDYK